MVSIKGMPPYLRESAYVYIMWIHFSVFLMAKKKTSLPAVQKPVIMAALFLVMLVALAFVLQSYPGGDEPLPDQEMEVRSGDQVATVTILPNDGDETGETMEAPAMTDKAMEQTGDGMGSILAGERVQYAIDRFQKLATQPLKFQVFGAAGNEISPDYLRTIRGAKVHFYVVHTNMKLFHHIEPNYADGVWNARTYMPWEGTYQAYVVVDPIKGSPAVYRSELVVRNESPEDIDRADPAEVANDASSSAYTSTMEMKRFDTYRGFLFEIQRNGEPVVITPQRDALGEMTVLSHGNPEFIRIDTADAASEEQLGKVSFSMDHLQPGRYTAFVEVLVDGQTRLFAHTFDIGT